MSAPVTRVVFPHQLFAEHFDAGASTHFVLYEDDLFFRQYAFIVHKLVLHRGSMTRFAAELRGRGFEVTHLRSSADRVSAERLTELLAGRGGQVEAFDPVDDYASRGLASVCETAGVVLRPALESPNFICTRSEIRTWFSENPFRMARFYEWQRRRFDILMDGASPRGGKFSFDADNRKKLPKGHTPPAVSFPDLGDDVRQAIDEVRAEFPGAPGHVESFCWPTTRGEALAMMDEFFAERFELFGPYEDAISSAHAHVYHALLTPALNIGLLTPMEVVERALEVGQDHDVPLPSLEGFVRQVLGWREYMRATYVLFGRQMRTRNALGHTRELPPGWYDGSTGLDPVDTVVKRLLHTGYAHHIERLMVFGNALCLLRVHPDQVYRWFSEMFVDAYDWVMVPNVYAMSQFAAGDAITTKPYVSGSNYLKKMSDFGPGDWRAAWDGLYWEFVSHHRETFAANHRSKMVLALLDKQSSDQRAAHAAAAAPFLAS